MFFTFAASLENTTLIFSDGANRFATSYVLVTMMRRGGRFRRMGYSFSTTLDPSANLQEEWKRWIGLEGFKRLSFRLLTFDTQLSTAVLSGPLISYAEMQLPLPEHEAIWSASSAERWMMLSRSKVTSFDEKRPSLVDIINEIDQLSMFRAVIDERIANEAMLSASWGLVWEYNQSHSVQRAGLRATNSLVMGSRYDELLKMMQRFKISIGSSVVNSVEFPVRLESTLMRLHISLDDVQLFAGIDGISESSRVYPALKEWAMSQYARKTVWHAGQIMKAVKGYSHAQLLGPPAIHVYHAGLALWVFGMLSGNSGGVCDDSMRSNLLPQQPVWLDGHETVETHHFVTMGRGRPCISGPRSSRGDGQTLSAYLDTPSAVVDVVLDIIHCNYQGASMPRLIENLVQILVSLRDIAIKLGM